MGKRNSSRRRPGRRAFTLIELLAMRKRKSVAFTLIELLVVISIIAILAGLLLPTIGKSKEAAYRARAGAEVKALETAFKGYYSEYGKWPKLTLTGYPNPVDETANGLEMLKEVVDLMKGDDIQKNNPRKVRFMEFPDNALKTGQFVDPWGNPYKVMVDFNYDNKVHIEFTNNSGSTNLYRSVAAWSRGPDGSDENTKRADDALSWQ